MNNPSNITITVGDINFDVVMNEFDAVVGRVYVKDAVIPPGGKTYNAEMRLGEKSTNSKAVSQMLGDYLTSAKIPLTIKGSSDSTKIAPLGPALSSVKLATEMTGIAGNLISQIAVKGSIIGLLIQKKGSASITLKNPLHAPFAIKTVKAAVVFKPSSGAAPFTVGTIDYNLPSPATVPAQGQMTTDEWPVSIEGSGIEHLGQMLGLLLDPEKYFDVQQNVTVSVGDGYNSEMFYYQDKVPFTIQIDSLPPIGITASSLSKMTLPSNITSTTDPNLLEQMIKDILSGKTPASSSAISSTADATSTVTSSSSIKATETTTKVSATTEASATTTKDSEEKTTTTEAKPTATTTTEKDSETKSTTTEAAETTTKKPFFSLPF